MISHKTKNITCEVAAKDLGTSPSMVRYMLKENLVPFGVAFRRENSDSYRYIIFPEKYREYVNKGEEA